MAASVEKKMVECTYVSPQTSTCVFLRYCEVCHDQPNDAIGRHQRPLHTALECWGQLVLHGGQPPTCNETLSSIEISPTLLGASWPNLCGRQWVSRRAPTPALPTPTCLKQSDGSYQCSFCHGKSTVQSFIWVASKYLSTRFLLPNVLSKDFFFLP